MTKCDFCEKRRRMHIVLGKDTPLLKDYISDCCDAGRNIKEEEKEDE